MRTDRARVFTARQREVIRLLAEGCSNAEIAVRLGVTDRTAKAHCDALRSKLGVARRRYIPTAFRSTTGEDPLAPIGSDPGPRPVPVGTRRG
jgi:DNA-binding CsgD family transcriptional regulator